MRPTTRRTSGPLPTASIPKRTSCDVESSGLPRRIAIMRHERKAAQWRLCALRTWCRLEWGAGSVSESRSRDRSYSSFSSGCCSDFKWSRTPHTLYHQLTLANRASSASLFRFECILKNSNNKRLKCLFCCFTYYSLRLLYEYLYRLL